MTTLRELYNLIGESTIAPDDEIEFVDGKLRKKMREEGVVAEHSPSSPTAAPPPPAPRKLSPDEVEMKGSGWLK